MEREKYMDLLDNDADIDLKDKDIAEWLDAIVEPLVQAQRNRYDLNWGTCKDGSYNHSIYLINEDVAKVHIYSGIESLAKAVGQKVSHKFRGRDTEYPHEYYFKYKNAYVFEIRGEGVAE